MEAWEDSYDGRDRPDTRGRAGVYGGSRAGKRKGRQMSRKPAEVRTAYIQPSQLAEAPSDAMVGVDSRGFPRELRYHRKPE